MLSVTNAKDMVISEPNVQLSKEGNFSVMVAKGLVILRLSVRQVERGKGESHD